MLVRARSRESGLNIGAEEQLAARFAALRNGLEHVVRLVSEVDDLTPGRRLSAVLKEDIERLNGEFETATGWSGWANLARSTRQLAQEVLELAAGIEMRSQGLDDGLCALADALLDEVTASGGPRWSAAAIPADADFIGERDHVIRLRWPGDGIWTLPLALHELGHFVGRRIEARERLDPERWAILRPFEDRLRETGEEVPADWHHAHELFADAYATYVGGPAYFACCVTLSFDPTQEPPETRTHPASSRRVRLMTEILGRMDNCAGNSASMYYEIDAWRRTWANVASAAGDPFDGPLDESDLGWADFFWTTLRDHLPNSRYRSLNLAKKLAGQLLREAELMAGSAHLVDVLNAAWVARHELETASGLAALASRSRSLLEQVAARD